MADYSHIGTISVRIDDFTPCLKSASTGELVDTEVIRIRRKSFLSSYNIRNGWYTNWASLVDNAEIYALVVKGTVDIQGLVALQRDPDAKAVYIQWMCTATKRKQKHLVTKEWAGICLQSLGVFLKKPDLMAMFSDLPVIKRFWRTT